MKNIIIYSILIFIITACGGKEANNKDTNQKSKIKDSIPVEPAKKVTRKIEESRTEVNKSFKVNIIRNKTSSLLKKIKYIQEKGIANPSDIIYFLDTISSTCEGNIENVSFKYLENCENTLDYIDSKITAKYKVDF